LGIKKSDILNKDESNLAVRVALSETELIKQAKEDLINEGIDFDCLINKDKIERSKNILILKNLPPETSKEEIETLFSKYEDVEIILTKNKCKIIYIKSFNIKKINIIIAMYFKYKF
jgi:hypothetical protein